MDAGGVSMMDYDKDSERCSEVSLWAGVVGDKIIITWPGGRVQRIGETPSNQMRTIVEP